ncbi:MAG: 1,4-alpha-glucan branching protein [Terrimonas sp.]|nr:1,4-alpha-glucan branching protein [Terrimonas sp.]OJY87452.1 MAG: 1,4-alpha-glucan branching protein [Sphingobacteriales bacterium 40-81]
MSGDSIPGSFKRVEWSYNTNIYEINLRQYTREGTFNAFLKELPRLKAMGVQTLWIMPINPIAKEKMKGTMGSYYACSDYTAVNPEFGTLDDFKNFVKEAHKSGFKVILDWVANHTGWGHIWTKTNPGFYKKNADGSFMAASGMDDIIELDYDNPALVQAMIEAMKFWITTCDIDGFRCDLASWVELHFWQKARPELEKIKPLFWLGEFDAIENPDYMEVFDAAYAWKWMHATEDFYKHNRNVQVLRDLLLQYEHTNPPGTTGLYFTSNHDENSWNGTEFEKYGDMALALSVLSFTWNGIPLIYSGQEMPNHKRLMFFDKDVIEWNGKYELADFFTTLLKLHSEHPALAAGSPMVQTNILSVSTNADILAYQRTYGKNNVLVFLNLSPYPSTVQPEINIATPMKELFTGELKSFIKDKTISLSQWGYKVYVN